MIMQIQKNRIQQSLWGVIYQIISQNVLEIHCKHIWKILTVKCLWNISNVIKGDVNSGYNLELKVLPVAPPIVCRSIVTSNKPISMVIGLETWLEVTYNHTNEQHQRHWGPDHETNTWQLLVSAERDRNSENKRIKSLNVSLYLFKERLNVFLPSQRSRKLSLAISNNLKILGTYCKTLENFAYRGV